MSLRCRFCGNGDRLPADELGRAMEIRGRLLLAAGPHTREAFVPCRFCRTQNVLPKEAAESATRRLDEELRAYHARARGIFASTSLAGTRMTRTLVLCFAGVYAALLALGALANLVLSLAPTTT
jgi:hypothetical protein